MKRYKNLAGDSGVVAYEAGADWIAVRFRSGEVYRYTHTSAGRRKVEQMKTLAEAGRGLSTFISTSVGDDYDSKSP